MFWLGKTAFYSNFLTMDNKKRNRLQTLKVKFNCFTACSKYYGQPFKIINDFTRLLN